MAKARSQYICRSCGSVHPRWMGKCPDCGSWDALEQFIEPKIESAASGSGSALETWAAAMSAQPAGAHGHEHRAIDDADESSAFESASGHGRRAAGGAATMLRPCPLPEVQAADVPRLATTIHELDRVLGGGLVAGSVIMLGGDPGIGKSTLLLEAAGRLAQHKQRVLYVSSEESAHQTRLRAERVFGSELDQLQELFVQCETNLTRIVEQAAHVQPRVMVIDSIQMLHNPALPASPGSVTQLRRCCMELVHLAKATGTTVIVVGHVTKDGKLAGPKLLEHLVDTVLAFEGDQHHAYRVVRSIKNRFGTTLEVGLFEMTGRGLEQVSDATRLLGDGSEKRPGAVICPVMHGTRCLLVEVQALTATGFLGAAKRKTSGIDSNRLAMLIAVLEKHGGLRLADQDVFVSTTGGMKVVEPAADLAICLAIAGAHTGKAVPIGLGAAAEVGLDGRLRVPTQLDARMNELMRLGHGPLLTASVAKEKREAQRSTTAASERRAVGSISEALEHLDT